MKGYVYYTEKESVRNHLFIKDLMRGAKLVGIDLQLLIGKEKFVREADFILFRDRNATLASGFEDAGFRLFNRMNVHKIANNKLRTFELASLLGIPAVPTKKVRNVHEITTYPAVLKTVDGHGGHEVFLCTTPSQAASFLKKFDDHELIIQPYIESGARDVRVFLIGEEIVGAVKRTGNGSFKSNYTLGGSVEKYVLSNWQEKEVVTIARALKSDYIGIDFLLLRDGSWLLNEIEDPVGARSLYLTHNFSIAEKLMGYIKEKVESERR